MNTSLYWDFQICIRSAASFLEKIDNGLLSAEVYSVSKMELFTEVVNRLKLWTIFAKISILDFWRGSEYASFCLKNTDKKYSTYNGRYIVLKAIYKWIFRKGNILLQKKKISFFCFWFSIQTRKDLALVKF